MKLFTATFLVFLMLCGTLAAEVPLDKTPYWRSIGSGFYSTGLQWHDMDRDGYLDLFISNGNDMNRAKNFAFHNDAGVIPTLRTWLSSNAEYSGHCAVGDINYDGYPEMFVSNYLGSSFSVPNKQDMYLNNAGTLTSAPYWISADSTWAFSCTLADVDGDGDLDYVVACGEPYNGHLEHQRIYFNNNGVMETTPSWTSALSYGFIDVAAGDVDNDGDLDIAFCGDNSPVVIFRNNGGIMSSVPGWISGDTECSNTLAWGDMDQDGYLDLAVADNNQLGGQGKFKVYRNSGGTLGTTPYWQSGDGGYGSAVSWCDIDRDGQLELATGRWWGYVSIYDNTGSTLTADPVWQSDESSVIEEIQFADVDRSAVGRYVQDISLTSGRKLYYLQHMPIHSVDSVIVDGVRLGFNQYCYSIVDGWVSLGTAPASSMVVYYQFSLAPDMGISNWDTANFIYANGWFMRGDVDNSGGIDIGDVVYLIAYIFSGGQAPNPLLAGDTDCSGGIDIADAVYLITFIFSGGPSPCDS